MKVCETCKTEIAPDGFCSCCNISPSPAAMEYLRQELEKKKAERERGGPQ